MNMSNFDKDKSGKSSDANSQDDDFELDSVDRDESYDEFSDPDEFVDVEEEQEEDEPASNRRYESANKKKKMMAVGAGLALVLVGGYVYSQLPGETVTVPPQEPVSVTAPIDSAESSAPANDVEPAPAPVVVSENNTATGNTASADSAPQIIEPAPDLIDQGEKIIDQTLTPVSDVAEETTPPVVDTPAPEVENAVVDTPPVELPIEDKAKADESSKDVVAQTSADTAAEVPNAVDTAIENEQDNAPTEIKTADDDFAPATDVFEVVSGSPDLPDDATLAEGGQESVKNNEVFEIVNGAPKELVQPEQKAEDQPSVTSEAKNDASLTSAKDTSSQDKKAEPVKDGTPKTAYFDSPGGKILSNIPAPSMNPMKGAGESIIIVSKKPTPPPAPSGATPSSIVSFSSTDLNSTIIEADRALKSGQYDRASALYESLYKINPSDARILMGRALLFQKTGQIALAEKAYDDLLKVDPDNTGAVVNLAGLISKEYPAEALSKLLDLREKYPSNPAVIAQLGITYAETGNFEDARKYLELATTLEPQSAQHYYNLAVVSEKSGKKVEAVTYYQKALDVASVNPVGVKFSSQKVADRISYLSGR